MSRDIFIKNPLIWGTHVWPWPQEPRVFALTVTDADKRFRIPKRLSRNFKSIKNKTKKKY